MLALDLTDRSVRDQTRSGVNGVQEVAYSSSTRRDMGFFSVGGVAGSIVGPKQRPPPHENIATDPVGGLNLLHHCTTSACRRLLHVLL